MKTRYFCSLAVARMSAPWMVWSKKPKMSMEYFLAYIHGLGKGRWGEAYPYRR